MASHFLTRFTANDSQQRRHKVRKVLLEMLERRELLAADCMADSDYSLVSQFMLAAQHNDEITFTSSDTGMSGVDVTAYLDQAIGSGTASASLTDRPWFGLVEESYQKWSQENGLAFSFTSGLTAEGEGGGLVGEGEGPTALDAYVAAPDPSYSFNIISTTPGLGHTLYDLEMTSQTWRTVTEVNWDQWKHRMSIIIPTAVTSSKSLLVIDGGSHNGSTGGHGGAVLQSTELVAATQLAISTGTVVSAISNVPYQPLRFQGESNNRSEDSLIAKSYREFLDGTDDEWPALLPMVKSAVRAMDTVQTVAQQQRGLTVTDFVVTGGSKRGWTTWLTAAVDSRVSAIAPQVINVLNMDEQMQHHRQAYEDVTVGLVEGYSVAVRDYVNEGIFDEFGNPRGDELLRIVDPYEYRDRLTMPKFMINATGDEFFVPDSDQFFFHDLLGQNHLRYVPNVGHGLGPDAITSLAQFYGAMVNGSSLPEFSWTVTSEGVIDVTTLDVPVEVRLWQATNPVNRDFRHSFTRDDVQWTSSTLIPQSPGRYLASVARPQSGHTAYMVELTYNVAGQPMKFTTEVTVMSADPDDQFDVGPRLLSVAPNSGVIFSFNEVNTLQVSPTELVLRFDDFIDTSNLNGIQLIAAGKDSTFGNNNDRTITPGWIGAGDNERIIVMRFDQPLEDDLYRVQLAATGDDAVRNKRDNPAEVMTIATRRFDSTPSDRSIESVDFRLQLGAKVLGVVPQPVDRLPNGTLNPRRDVIRVYFNDDDLHPTAIATGAISPNPSVVDPAYYQLIFTNDTVQPSDDAIFAPTSISYDPTTDMAELTFSGPIDQLVAGGGTFRLRVGSREPVNGVTNPPVVQQVNESGDAPGNVSSVTPLATFNSSATVLINGSVVTTSPNVLPIDFPGSIFEPGHRDIQDETHVNAGPDQNPQISTVFYNFMLNESYGNNAAGQPLFTSITPEQMRRVREIFDIYSALIGVDFVETENAGLIIAVGDMFPLGGTPSGPLDVLGVAGPLSNGQFEGRPAAIMDGAENWDNSFGENPSGLSFFGTAIHEVGHLLGLGHTYDLPPGTVMGFESELRGPQAFSFPGEHDIAHGLHLHRRDNRDVDMYSVVVPAGQGGQLSAEVLAERLAAASNLDSHLTVFKQTPSGIEVVAANSGSFGRDAAIRIELPISTAEVTYFIAVTAKGNEDFHPEIANTGSGGFSEGNYQLRVSFHSNVLSDPAPFSVEDLDGTSLDGDGDGIAGGNFNFWFRALPPSTGIASTTPRTIFVDKAYTGITSTGSPTQPMKNLNFETWPIQVRPKPGDIVRVAGHDSDVNPRTLPAYEFGRGGVGNQILADGLTLQVPQGVTLMIDAGAIFKLQGSQITTGSQTASVNHSNSALQILGKPGRPVHFTSYKDEARGIDTNPIATVAALGDWGGIHFRNDVDRGQGRFGWERHGIFLDYLAGAEIRFGGGQVTVLTPSPVVSPVMLSESRPTIINNVILSNADSAISADPNSFEETWFTTPRYQNAERFAPDYSRVGPDIRGNLAIDNTINGLFIRTVTGPGAPLTSLDFSAKFDDRDIVHVISENLIVGSQPGGNVLDARGLDLSLVQRATLAGGSMSGSQVRYIVTTVDRWGNIGPASIPTASFSVGFGGAVSLTGLPPATGDFVGRSLWRSTNGGSFELVAELDRSTSNFTDTGATLPETLSNPNATSNTRGRPNARLEIAPGTIVKLSNARIETSIGAQLIAEGTSDRPIIFTSRSDDRFGAGGTFDTFNDGNSNPGSGDWGGLVALHLSNLSLDHVLVVYGGGLTSLPGGFAGFNAVEVHQASARIANSRFEMNNSGLGGDLEANRAGRGPNASSVIYVMGSQPTIINNRFTDNTVSDTSAISINADALKAVNILDQGRQTGDNARLFVSMSNQGPLVRGNAITNTGINGMVVRGQTLTTESVWDDTDITHVLFDEIVIPDFHTYGGLTLKSRVDEGLVVKLSGTNAGFTAKGRPLDIADRIGGSLRVLGTPGFPVVLTALADDSVGAGFDTNGRPLLDTNNNGSSVALPGSWRSIRFDPYANDRNVAMVGELETDQLQDIGTNDVVAKAQNLGSLAASLNGGDENLRLGVSVDGAIASASDLDVYSFSATAGSMVWLDIDRTSGSLDSVLELVDSNGTILAQSVSALSEALGWTSRFVSSDTSKILPQQVLGLDASPFAPRNIAASNASAPVTNIAADFHSVNPHDAGMRIILPGTPGQQSTYFLRVRSSNVPSGSNPATNQLLQDPARLAEGKTSGTYRLQVRLRQATEVPGSVVQFADIRYATNGIEALGMPGSSPLLGQVRAASATSATNPGGASLGNIFNSDRGSVSVAGNLAVATGYDEFTFTVSRDSIQSPGRSHVSVVFDIDYADGFGGPDTTLWVYNSEDRLVYVGTRSNISDDQAAPLRGTDVTDLTRGSAGSRDPYIGPVELLPGDYRIRVTSNRQMARDMEQFMLAQTNTNLVRFEPVDSVRRLAIHRFDSVNFETASAPFVTQVLFDANVQNQLLQWNLSDITTYVLRNQGSGSELVFANAMTGARTADISRFPRVNDIAMSPDGRLVGYEVLTAGPTTDANGGNFLLINSSGTLNSPTIPTGAATQSGTSGIQTFTTQQTSVGATPAFAIQQRDHTGPGNGNTPQGDSIVFNALSFYDNGLSTLRLFGVGSRGNGQRSFALPIIDPASGNVVGILPDIRNYNTTNIVYGLDPVTGAAINPDGADDRTDGARIFGAGTQKVEFGRFLSGTATQGYTDGTVTGLAEINGVLYAVSNLGEFFVAPLGGNGTQGFSSNRSNLVPPTTLAIGGGPNANVNPVIVNEGQNAVFNVIVLESSVDETYSFRLAGSGANPTEDIDIGTLAFSDGVTHNPESRSITVPAGVTRFSVTVPTVDDVDIENSEAFDISVGNLSSTGRIIDNDTVGTVLSIGGGDDGDLSTIDFREGESGDYIVRVSNSVTDQDYTFGLVGTGLHPVDILADIADVTFSDGVTLNTVTNLITVPAGVSEFIVTVTSDVELMPEFNESFEVQVGGLTAGGLIKDIDSISNLSSNETSVTEGNSATFIVQLAVGRQQEVFDFRVVGSGPDPIIGIDIGSPAFTFCTPGDCSSIIHDPVAGTLTIPQGINGFLLTVPTIDDAIVENTEQFRVELVQLGVSMDIEDNDTPTISNFSFVSAASLNEGQSFVLRANLPFSAVARTIGFDIRGVDPNPISITDDIVSPVFNQGVTRDAVNQTILVPAGVTSFTVTLPTVNDTLNESNEQFEILLDGTTLAGTIRDNDPVSVTSLTPGFVSVNEGVSAVYTVTLSNLSVNDVTIPIELEFLNPNFVPEPRFDGLVFSDGVTLNGPIDGNGGVTVITVPAGVTTFTVALQTLHDDIAQNESSQFRILLGAEESFGEIRAENYAVYSGLLPTTSIIDPETNSPVVFNGLTSGPRNMQGGALANVLFGTTADGTIYAFDTAGNLQPVFPGFSYKTRSTNPGTSLGSAVSGIDFSPLDVNLWHLSDLRTDEPGHGRTVPFDRSQTADEPGVRSLYFGFRDTGSPTGQQGQWGSLHDGVYDQTYNLPGGAQGAIITKPIDLSGYSPSDLPMLYFNYLLETEAQNNDLQQDNRMRDAFRVYGAGEDGSWVLLATNNTPSDGGQVRDRRNGRSDELDNFFNRNFDSFGQPLHSQELFDDAGWRQARVPLGALAGKSNVRLRFEFSTAATFGTGNPLLGGIELTAVDSWKITDGTGFAMARGEVLNATAINNFNNPALAPRRFEFDLGLVLALPGGASLPTGFSVTLDGTVLNFTPGVDYQLSDSPEIIASLVRNAVESMALVGVSVTTNPQNSAMIAIAGLTSFSSSQLPLGVVQGMPGVAPTWSAPGGLVVLPVVAIPINFEMDATQVGAAMRTAFATAYSDPNMLASFGTAQAAAAWPHHENILRLYKFVVSADPNFNNSAIGITTARAGDQFGVDPRNPNAASFAHRDERALENNHQGLFIDDIIIGFAERGEMVFGGLIAGSNPPFVPNLQFDQNLYNINQIDAGRYQLTTRTASDYGTTDTSQNLVLAPIFDLGRDFHTNDRLARGLGIAVNIDDAFAGTSSAAGRIVDGTSFTLSDTKNLLTFEFDVTAGVNDPARGVTQGSVPVAISSTATTLDIAVAIRSAINSPEVQAVLGITASTRNQDVGSIINNNSPIIEIHGNASTDLAGGWSFSSSTHLTALRWGSDTTFGEDLGDVERERPQGQLLLHSNTITNASQFGVVTSAADRDQDFGQVGNRPYPGATINFPSPNLQRLAPGVVIVNNILANNTSGGLRVSGDPGLDATVQIARVINNTIYAGSDGILIEGGASPTILNNIFASTGTGVRAVGSTSAVLGANIYENNLSNVSGVNLGTFDIELPTVPADAQTLFVSTNNRKFYLAGGARAIDASLEALQERTELTQVKSPLGLPLSPMLAPNRDVNGLLRVDDPNVNSPDGMGGNVFKDRGAVERADFVSPEAVIINPLDNDALLRDTDRTVTYISLEQSELSFFSILLQDVNGTGPDASTIVSDAITLTENGRLLREGIDFVLGYNANARLLKLTPLAGIWRQDSVYEITLSNSNFHRITVPNGSSLNDGDTVTIVRVEPSQTRTLVFEFDNNDQVVDGNIPVSFNAGSTAYELAAQMTYLINRQGVSNLNSRLEGVGQLTINGATTVSTLPETMAVTSSFVPAIRDLAGNRLQPNRATGTTQFTIVMPGAMQDFGDGHASLPTRSVDNGARHVILPIDLAPLALGTWSAPNDNGAPSIAADSDDYSTSYNLGTLGSAGGIIQGPIGPARLIFPAATGLDGQRIVVADTGNVALPPITFEFDTNNNAVAAPNKVVVSLLPTDSSVQVASKFTQAVWQTILSGRLTGLVPVSDGNEVSMGGSAQHVFELLAAPGIQRRSAGNILLVVPNNLSNLADGQTMSITDSMGRAVVFELNSTGGVAAGRVAINVDLSTATAESVAASIAAAVQSQIDTRRLWLGGAAANGPTVTIIGDDEEGVTFGGLFNAGSAPVPVVVNSTGFGMLDAWIDWNGNGSLSDSGDRVVLRSSPEETNTVATSVPVRPGVNVFYVQTPANAAIGVTTARFRLSTTGGLLTGGVGVGGEIEDHLIEIVGGQPPVVVSNQYSLDEDQILVISDSGNGVLANDTDPDVVLPDVIIPGVNLRVFDENPSTPQIVPLVDVQHGVLQLNADGTFTYTPDLDFNGTDTFVYRATDGRLVSNQPTTVTITVNPVNDAPLAIDDTIDIIEGQTLSEPGATFTANDFQHFRMAMGTGLHSNEAGQALRLTAASIVSEVRSDLGVSGTSVRFRSQPGQGTYGISLVVTSSNLGLGVLPQVTVSSQSVAGNILRATIQVTLNSHATSSSTIQQMLTAINGHAQAGALVQAALEVGNGSSVIGSSPTDYSPLVVPPSGGSVSVVNNQFTYTPPADYNNTIGGPAIVRLTIADDDSAGPIANLESHSLLTINIQASNDAPIFNLPTAQVTVREDEENITGASPTTFVNFATAIATGPATALDERNQQLQFEIVSISDPSLFSVAPTLSVDGTLSFQTAQNRNGVALVVVRLVDDGPGPNMDPGDTPASAPQTITITIQPVNDAPVFNLSSPIVTSIEDQGLVTVNGFLTGVLPGPLSAIDEQTQTVLVTLQALDPSKFIVPPSIDAQGRLTYQTGPDVNDLNADLRVRLILADNGPQPNDPLGPNDPPHQNRVETTFTISAQPVNDAPLFTLASSTIRIDEDHNGTGIFSSDPNAPFASNIAAGPATATDEGSQSLNFLIVSVSNPELFLPGQLPTITPGGLLNFRLAPHRNGSSVVFVRLRDDGIGAPPPNSNVSLQQTFTITVAPINDAPQFTIPSSVPVVEDQGLVSLASFASGIQPGPTQAVDESSQLVNFEVEAIDSTVFVVPPTISPSGTLVFRLVDNLNSQSALLDGKSLQVRVRLLDDGSATPPNQNASAWRTFTINVTPVNDSPVSPDYVTQTNEDVPIVILASDILANASGGPTSDEGNQRVWITQVDSTSTRGGTITPVFNAAGTEIISITYLPPRDAVGPDSFVFVMSDDGVPARQGTASVIVNILFENDPPQFDRGINPVVQEESGPQVITNWATNILPGPISSLDELATQTVRFEVVRYVSGEELFASIGKPAISNAGTLTFEPAVDAAGIAIFVVQAVDNGTPNARSAEVTVTVTIQPINDPPVFTSGGNVAVAEDSGAYSQAWATGIAPAAGLNANPPRATDESTQTVSFTIVSNSQPALFSVQPAVSSSGVLSFTPATNAFGSSVVIVRAFDSGSSVSPNNNASSLVTFTITISQENDAPVANNDSYSINENSVLTVLSPGVLANDTDLDLPDDELKVVAGIIQSTFGAAVVLNDNGSFTYDPRSVLAIQRMTSGQSIIDTFVYTIRDRIGATSNLATVSITVTGVDDPPVAVADSFTVGVGQAAALTILANDADVDSLINPASVQITRLPIFGSAVVLPTGVVQYTAGPGFIGTDTFGYTVRDMAGNLSNEALVVVAINNPPVANDDTAFTFKNEAVVISVLSNDTDSEGSLDPSSVQVVTPPSSGSTEVLPDGRIRYTPAEGFAGVVTFTYTVADNMALASNEATVTVRVRNSRWQNPSVNLDVNADGRISSIDALLIINYLNSGQPRFLPDSNYTAPPFIDVNGDERVNSTDALLVINELNRRSGGGGTGDSGGEGEAEGEADVASVSLAMMVTPQQMIDTVGRQVVEQVQQQLLEELQQAGNAAPLTFVGPALPLGSTTQPQTTTNRSAINDTFSAEDEDLLSLLSVSNEGRDTKAIEMLDRCFADD